MPTTLGAGDIAFVRFQADDPDAWSFVTLVPLDAGTVIHFTDNAWTAAGAFSATEGTLTWTAPGTYPAGSVIGFSAVGTDGFAAAAGGGSGGFSLSTAGDNILAYQGRVQGVDASFLAALASSAFVSGATTSNTTTLPPGLTLGGTAIALTAIATETDNAVYAGPTAGAGAALLAAINDAANWTLDNTAVGAAPAVFTLDGTPSAGLRVTASGGPLQVSEDGATDTLALVLTAAPTGDVTVTASQAGVDLTLSAATFTFTPANWDLAQTLTVGAVDDALDEGAETIALGLAVVGPGDYAGLTPQTIPIGIADNDQPVLAIGTVQGAGHGSDHAGQIVTIRGNVTARAGNGFYVQDAGDGEVATSDGLFVFTGSAPAASLAVGDGVRVTGTVAEFLPGGNANNLTLTELTAATAVEQAPIPGIAPTLIGAAGRLPPTTVTQDDDFTSFDPATDGVDFWESLEGMQVVLAAPRAIAATNGFGETWLVTDQGANATGLNARGGLTLTESDSNPERIQIDTDTSVLPGFNPTITLGDILSAVTGVVSYNFGEYEVVPTGAFSVTPGGLAPETTVLQGGTGKLLVAEYNVENLDPGDPTFDAIARHILVNLNRPDIVALQEIQDDNGATNNGVTSADATLQKLVDAIVAAGGPAYRFAYIAPADGTSGGEPGGNIRNAFLYLDSRVELVSLGQVTDTALTAGDAFAASRIPLVGSFAFEGRTVTLINVHSSSKGGSSTDYGAFFPPVDPTEANRVAQATEINAAVDTLIAADPNARVLVLGDHNGFAWEDSQQVMRGALGADRLTPGTAVLADLALSEPERERYTYVFDGNSQALDHTLATGAAHTIARFDTVHVNSEFPDALRVSDHDPSVTLLDFTRAAPLLSAGDVDQDSAVLLAKVLAAGPVRFEVATSEDFATLVACGTAAVTDPLVPAKLALTDGTLSAGTQYFWRATDAAGDAESGRFRTADAATVRDGFSLGVSGDWRGELAPYPAIANADTAGLDVFLKFGDTIYADYPSPALDQPQALSLADYLTKHLEVYSERAGLNAWNDLQKTTAILAVIDDHEVVNDFAGGAAVPVGQEALYGAGDAAAVTPGMLVNDSPLYENGLAAFQSYNAIEHRTTPTTGSAPRTDGEPDLYRYSIQGQDAAIFVADARSFRDPELAPWNGTPADAPRFLGQAFTPGRTLLGEPQLARLAADLLDADAQGITWKFVNLPEPVQNYGPLNAQDRYEGYAAERSALLQFIDDNDIENVVFVSADVHGTTVNNLTYQLPTAAGLSAQIALPSFEITTGSVAFDAPFGPVAVEAAAAFGLVSPAQLALYNSLPVADDADSLPNDRGDFFKLLLNQQLDAFGYDRVGLNDNLAQARGLLSATLQQGDYVAVDTFGWTRFDVDAATGALTVTTYGIPAYTEATAGTAAAVDAIPAVVSRFTVAASRAIEFTLFRDAAGGDALADFSYGNAAIAGMQTASALVDSTGADLARFHAAGGDVAISQAIFASGQAVAGMPAAQLTWSGGDAATLALSVGWGTVQAVAVSDFTGAALTLRNWAEVSYTGQPAAGQAITLDGARAGSVTLGRGDDVVRIGVANDGDAAAANRFAIDTGAGDDLVRFVGTTIAAPRGSESALAAADARLGAGDDRFEGGAGADTVAGGAGADTLSGGGGQNLFRFDSIAEGDDTIRDFVHGTDQIGLQAGSFGFEIGALSAAGFALDAASGNGPQLVYAQASSTLFYDADGIGTGEAAVLAMLVNGPVLDVADFIVLA